MYQWQNLLDNGNNCFHEQNWQQAEYYYKEAVSYLDLLWSADTRDVRLLMAWICAYHNLAALFDAQNNSRLSLQYLLIPHNRMRSICALNGGCEDTKLIANNALKITFMPILLFSKQHPICEKCERTLAEFKEELESNRLLVH